MKDIAVNDRIIPDMGDDAAIGFLGGPETERLARPLPGINSARKALIIQGQDIYNPAQIVVVVIAAKIVRPQYR